MTGRGEDESGHDGSSAKGCVYVCVFQRAGIVALVRKSPDFATVEKDRRRGLTVEQVATTEMCRDPSKTLWTVLTQEQRGWSLVACWISRGEEAFGEQGKLRAKGDCPRSSVILWRTGSKSHGILSAIRGSLLIMISFINALSRARAVY